MIIPEWVPIPDNLRYNAAVARLDKAVYALIAERRAARAAASWGGGERGDIEGGRGGRRGKGEAATVSAPDLLDRLIDARDDGDDGDGGGMDDRALRDELMTLMVAGQETSAILLSWACALLAQHPEAAARCAEEAARVIGPDPVADLPGAADYAELSYTEAVILETMRLLPPAYMVGRCCAEDVTVGGYSLRKGTTVLISPYLMHRDARLWDDPLTFSPERWLRPGGSPKAGSHAVAADDAPSMARGALKGMGPGGVYVPFGAGPRVCIGTGFAMMEAVLLLAAVTRGVELRLKPGAAPPAPKALITLRPDRVELDVIPKRRIGAARETKR